MYRALFPGRQYGRGVKLTTQLHPVPRLIKSVPGTQPLLYVFMAVYRDKEIVIAYKTASEFQEINISRKGLTTSPRIR